MKTILLGAAVMMACGGLRAGDDEKYLFSPQDTVGRALAFDSFMILHPPVTIDALGQATWEREITDRAHEEHIERSVDFALHANPRAVDVLLKVLENEIKATGLDVFAGYFSPDQIATCVGYAASQEQVPAILERIRAKGFSNESFLIGVLIKSVIISGKSIDEKSLQGILVLPAPDSTAKEVLEMFLHGCIDLPRFDDFFQNLCAANPAFLKELGADNLNQLTKRFQEIRGKSKIPHDLYSAVGKAAAQRDLAAPERDSGFGRRVHEGKEESVLDSLSRMYGHDFSGMLPSTPGAPAVEEEKYLYSVPDTVAMAATLSSPAMTAPLVTTDILGQEIWDQEAFNRARQEQAEQSIHFAGHAHPGAVEILLKIWEGEIAEMRKGDKPTRISEKSMAMYIGYAASPEQVPMLLKRVQAPKTRLAAMNAGILIKAMIISGKVLDEKALSGFLASPAPHARASDVWIGMLDGLHDLPDFDHVVQKLAVANSDFLRDLGPENIKLYREMYQKIRKTHIVPEELYSAVGKAAAWRDLASPERDAGAGQRLYIKKNEAALYALGRDYGLDFFPMSPSTPSIQADEEAIVSPPPTHNIILNVNLPSIRSGSVLSENPMEIIRQGLKAFNGTARKVIGNDPTAVNSLLDDGQPLSEDHKAQMASPSSSLVNGLRKQADLLKDLGEVTSARIGAVSITQFRQIELAEWPTSTDGQTPEAASKDDLVVIFKIKDSSELARRFPTSPSNTITVSPGENLIIFTRRINGQWYWCPFGW